MAYDAIFVVSFGGPEGPEEVMPFLENVLRGRPVPEERKREVAEHYYQFGGVSPINAQNRALIAALRTELDAAGIALPIYFGNRNWKPTIGEALREMKAAGVRRALAFFTSAFSCYSGCRQYRENIRDARAEIGEGAPEVDKLRMPFNHPGFVAANADRVREALERLPPGLRDEARLLFTAHSIPSSMAACCSYERQLRESARLVAEALGWSRWDLVFQSRSGSPHTPWLEPDVCDFIGGLPAEGCRAVAIAPIGFLSDHMEVIYDLDHEAAEVCAGLGLAMSRAGTVGTHPRFVAMIRELIEERIGLRADRLALGPLGPWHDVCPENCCLPGLPAGPGRPRPARPGA